MLVLLYCLCIWLTLRSFRAFGLHKKPCNSVNFLRLLAWRNVWFLYVIWIRIFINMCADNSTLEIKWNMVVFEIQCQYKLILRIANLCYQEKTPRNTDMGQISKLCCDFIDFFDLHLLNAFYCLVKTLEICYMRLHGT